MTLPALRRLLLFNLVTDADDPVFGFTTVWINALAQQVGQIDVITFKAGRLSLAPNVRVFSLGKEHGTNKAQQILNFYRQLGALLKQHHADYDACFAHMQPLFALMAAPLLKPYHIPITLWYAHKAVTPKLKMAEKVVKHIVTSSPDGFRLESDKLVIVGQGIDTEMFHPAEAPRPTGAALNILSVSRIAPIKHLEILVQAVHALTMPYQLTITGKADPGQEDYAAQLQAAASAHTHFTGGKSYEQLVQSYQQADVMVNLSATGSMDKAVLEALACGVPVICANTAYADFLAPWRDLLYLKAPSAEALAERLSRLAALPSPDRQALGAQLREAVLREHSLNGLVNRLLRVMQS